MRKSISYFMLGAVFTTTAMMVLDKTHYLDRLKREKNKMVQKIKAVTE